MKHDKVNYPISIDFKMYVHDEKMENMILKSYTKTINNYEELTESEITQLIVYRNGIRKSNIQYGMREINGIENDAIEIEIFCGLCEEKVSLWKCLNEGGGLTRPSSFQLPDNGSFYKSGEDKVVCSDCVKKHGVVVALQKAESVLSVLMKKANP